MARTLPTETVKDAPGDVEREYHHNSFGLITLGRSQVGGSGQALFGSALKHGTVVTIDISRAHLTSRYNKDFPSSVGEDTIVRLEMSESQFAQFVASMGQGGGTQVTLTHAPTIGTRLETMDQLENEPIKKTFEQDLAEQGRLMAENVVQVQNMLKEFTRSGAKAPSKKDLEAMHSLLHGAGQHMEGNMRFLQNSFAESMEKIVDSAKTEIEAFAHNTGLHAIAQGMTPVLAIKHETETNELVLDGEVSYGS
jgi:hypothetical protein